MKRLRSILSAGLALVLLASCAPAAPSQTPTPAPSLAPVGLTLTRERFPRLNGSTSTAPLARAMCAVLLGEGVEEVEDLVRFSKTTASYRALMNGEADLLIAAEPAETVVAEKEEAGFQWEMAPIATDALVFLVNEANPVESLTREELVGIYTGKITNWKEVGGEDREIIPFQRNAEAGSQTLMKKLVMGDAPLMEAPKDYVVATMDGLIEAVRAFDGSPGAIGYTVYYYANDMNMADGLKVVAVDDARPDAATIRSGTYPYTNPYYAVLSAAAPADSPARQVFNWLQGAVGQSLIDHEGYVSILEELAQVDWALGEAESVREVYTRLSHEPLTELIPSEDYGPLWPYVGAKLSGDWQDYDRYGLVTREGKIVVDPVYDSAYQLSYFDQTGSQWLPMYLLARAVEVPGASELEQRYAVAAMDGSWITPFQYRSVTPLAEDYIWVCLENGDGVMLDGALKERWRLKREAGDDLWLYQSGAEGAMYWNDIFGSFNRGGQQYAVSRDGEMLSPDSMMVYSRSSEGLVQAMDELGQWGYLNGEGKWAIQPNYSATSAFKNGQAIVERFGGPYQVIDTAGNVLLDSEEELTRLGGPDGTFWYVAYSGTDSGDIYLCRAEQVYDSALNPYSCDMVGRELFHTGMDRWMWERTPQGAALWSPLGSVQLTAAEPLDFIGYIDESVVAFSGESSGEENRSVWRLFRLDTGELLLETGPCEYASVMEDRATGERYLCTRLGNQYKIYDQEGNFLIASAGYPGLENGILSVRGDMSFGYRRLDGEWLFRVSLMKSQED